MKISNELKEYLVKEIRFVKEKMIAEKNPLKKNYFYSAVYGALDRSFKMEYDSLLVFSHFAFVMSYNTIQGTLAEITQSGGLSVLPLDDKDFEFIIKQLENYAKAIETNADEEIYHILEKVIEHAYSLSGPGHYLIEKGVIKK
jgi:hypothetical protein